MPILVSGRLATSVFSQAERKNFTPEPAGGSHAEALSEIRQAAERLIELVSLEAAGVCDGAGFWINRDPILNAARKLAAVAEQRANNGPPVSAG